MKKSILNLGVITLFVFAFIVSSCSKKNDTPAPMTNLSYTLMTSPDTVKANVLTTFTFEVMDMATNMNAVVTSPTCNITGLATAAMPLTKVSEGKFTGQYTFTSMGTANFRFGCMDNMAMAQSHDFTVTVK